MRSFSLNSRFRGRPVLNNDSIIEDNIATKCIVLDTLKYKHELEKMWMWVHVFFASIIHCQDDRKRNYDVNSETVISQNIRCLIIKKTSSSIWNKSNNVNDQPTTICLIGWISTMHISNYKRGGV